MICYECKTRNGSENFYGLCWYCYKELCCNGDATNEYRGRKSKKVFNILSELNEDDYSENSSPYIENE